MTDEKDAACGGTPDEPQPESIRERGRRGGWHAFDDPTPQELQTPTRGAILGAERRDAQNNNATAAVLENERANRAEARAATLEQALATRTEEREFQRARAEKWLAAYQLARATLERYTDALEALLRGEDDTK